MSIPWIPPYLGSYEDLINSLLHNPFFGSGRDRRSRALYSVAAPMEDPDPLPWRSAEPSPSPWSPAVSFLLSAISLKEVASTLPEGQLRNELAKGADLGIARIIEDICGTPPGKIRFPWPNPPGPWVYRIVSELAMVANTFQEGGLRHEVLRVAGQIAQRAFGSADVGKLHQE